MFKPKEITFKLDVYKRQVTLAGILNPIKLEHPKNAHSPIDSSCGLSPKKLTNNKPVSYTHLILLQCELYNQQIYRHRYNNISSTVLVLECNQDKMPLIE